MRRPARRLFTLRSAASLVLFLGVCVLWARSYGPGDHFVWYDPRQGPCCGLLSARGATPGRRPECGTAAAASAEAPAAPPGLTRPVTAWQDAPARSQGVAVMASGDAGNVCRRRRPALRAVLGEGLWPREGRAMVPQAG